MLEIDKSDIVSRLNFDNPWWDTSSPPQVEFETKPRRSYFAPFHKAVKNFQVRRAVVLMGPRRVGKTVMVFHSIRALLDEGVDPRQIMYASLETPIYTGLTLERLLGFFREQFNHSRASRLFVFFDEVQYHRDWEVHLKSLVDSYPNYRFVATGSAAAALRLKSTESGAGRFSDYVLPPLTFAEYLSFIGKEDEIICSREELDPIKQSDAFDAFVADEQTGRVEFEYRTRDIDALNQEFVNYLNFGGYPEAVFSDDVRRNPSQYIKSDIIDKVLLRDLPSLYGISDIQELNRLFTTLAYNTGNEVSLEGLSKSSGVAKNTIKRYLEYLEAAFLIRRVERIDNNSKRFKRAVCFKVYLTNPSMRSALFGRIESDSKAMGALAETAIFSQWQHSKSMQLYYARWNDGEVDLVHLDSTSQQPLWAVEVKWSDRGIQDRAELRSCVEFAKRSNLISSILVTTKTKFGEFDFDGVRFQFLPASLYAYTLGTNILRYENDPEAAAIAALKGYYDNTENREIDFDE